MILEYFMWLGETHPDLHLTAQDLRVFALRSCLNETHPADVAEDMDLPVNDALSQWEMTN